MGTRGLLGFVIKGKRIGSYNHFDSYLTGLGKKIMEFLMSLSPEEKAIFKERLEKITWVDQDEPVPSTLQARYIHLVKPDPEHDIRPVRFPNQWYSLLRNTQDGRSLRLILDGKLEHLINQTGFEHDSCFCEYVYFIDMDKEELEISGDREATIPFSDFSVGLMEKLDKEHEEVPFEETRTGSALLAVLGDVKVVSTQM